MASFRPRWGRWATLAVVIVGLVAVVAGGALGTVRYGTSRRSSPAAYRLSTPLVDGDAHFAGRMLTLLARESHTVALSPFSISEDLAMVDAGAKGKTAAQIGAALDFPLLGPRLAAAFAPFARAVSTAERPGATLRVANALYGQQGTQFRGEFLRTLADQFEAPLMSVDFVHAPAAALVTINSWVSRQTAGKIPRLLAASDVETDPPPVLVLLNAIYLDAKWAFPFAASDSHPAWFHTPGGTLRVPTMHQTGTFGYRAGEGYRVLELPYVGGRLAFDVLLPDRGQMPALQRRLAGGGILAVLRGLRPTQVNVALPKLKLEDRLELNGALSTLGMPLAFTWKANFSGIAGRPRQLMISKVVHEAFIRVDEQGTEAAAATGTIFVPTSAESLPPTTFEVNRPFVFVLRDRHTNAILFEGLISNPV